jgi:hypothetical protein
MNKRTNRPNHSECERRSDVCDGACDSVRDGVRDRVSDPVHTTNGRVPVSLKHMSVQGGETFTSSTTNGKRNNGM